MLSCNEMLGKLYELPQSFRTNMENKDYPGAKNCYDVARTVAVFMRLDEERMNELFGERGERGEIIRTGLFPEEKVQRAYLECIKSNMTHEAQKYPGIPGRAGRGRQQA